MNLDIGRRQPRIGLEERARGAGRDRQRPLAQRRILQAGHDAANRVVDDVVERDRLRAARHQPHLQMILQIVADAGRVEHDVDAVALQEIRRSDAGELQQLRRIIRAARDQDFPARPRGAQRALPACIRRPARAGPRTGCAAPAPRFRYADCCGSSPGEDRRSAELARRPLPRRGLEEAGAFLRRAVEIGVGGNAGLGGRHHEGFRQRIGVAPVRDRQRPAGAVIFVGAALLVFGLLEIGQHVVITPAGIAALAPAVVILMLAAHIEQAVDRARSAEHLAARLEHLAAVQPRLRLGLVHPVDGFFLEQLAVAERHMDPEIGVLRSGLQQQHRMLAVRAQAIGEHAAGRAGADDDVIEFGSVIIIVHWFPPRAARPVMQMMTARRNKAVIQMHARVRSNRYRRRQKRSIDTRWNGSKNRFSIDDCDSRSPICAPDEQYRVEFWG